MNNSIKQNLSPLWQQARRYFLGQAASVSLGAMALQCLENNSADAAKINPAIGLPELPHHSPTAKNVIFLTQSGGPSQIELFDDKPGLKEWAGKELPESVRQGQRLTTMTANQKQLIMPARTKFDQYGESGASLGEWLPYLSKVADDLCFVKSMVTDQINHAPAMTKFLTGHHLAGRPSLGAWSSYGLGSENRDMPDYLVLISQMKRPSDQPLYEHYWGSGFLPSRYQGVKLRNARDPVLYLKDPAGMPREIRRSMLDGIAELNQKRLELTGDPEIETRISQYEMAWRMQSSVPEMTDLSDEPESTFELYGPDSRRPGTYAANCIMARKLIERGVRFVQLIHPDWDHHSRLSSWCVARCRDTDQASAALVTDLKQRGLLDETLVLWGGEFGRSVAGQGKWDSPEGGRDHHPRCFTMWMAGGGTQPGLTYGATDDFSYNVAENPVHVRDLHATILHLLGIDHARFTYRNQGLDFKLTGVEESRMVHEILKNHPG
ncbi:MAG TPA: sulfatase [Planctomycetaceae bacterium]|nr:sulfatase [Planctomycetaceae bacterium]